MADLNINGVNYNGVEAINVNGTLFYPDAVRYNAQSLSEAQKAQARKNIGAVDEAYIATAENVEIVVPESDIAVVGKEYNLYKNTFIFGKLPVELYDVDIKINDSTIKSHNYNEVWRFTPITAGTYTITITVRDRKLGNSAIFATKTMTLNVVEDVTVSGRNVLFIGDSLTYAGIYPAEIQHNLSEDGITSIGTLEANRTINGEALAVKHEGRNGWATWDYAGTWADSLTKFQSSNNVFRNPSTNKFDLGYYMQTYHPGVTLNAVCLNLGTNGVGATGINVAGMDELIARIREYNADIPILIHVPIVEGVGESYPHLGISSTSQYMKMRWLELAKAFIEKYDGTLENVYVVPVYFNLDENNDFPKTEMAVSARNPATIERITDGHPNTYGYLKMADVYYNYLLKYMTQGNTPEEPEEPEPTVDNLVDPTTANDASPDTTTLFKDEWLNGYYLSAASIGAKSGCIITDIFPIAYGQKIKIEGVLLDTTEHQNRFRTHLFNADGSKFAGFGSYYNFAMDENVPNKGTSIIDVANNTITVDYTTALNVKETDSFVYARFSCYPAGANEDIKVTVVE